MLGGFADRHGVVTDDAGIVLHAGNPAIEQRHLAQGRAIVPLGDRAVVRVAGPDRLTWLDSITSQALTGLRPGESTELLVLSPQGRIEHQAAVIDDGQAAWLIADAGDAPGLAKWLTMMRFRSQVEIDVPDDVTVIGAVRGGAAEELLAAAAVRTGDVPIVWNDPWTGVSRGGWQYADTDAHPGAEYAWSEAIVGADGVDLLADAEIAGTLAAEALRVAAWRPRWQGEVDERTIPHEADWIRTAVHLDKGCYRGQETVAKVHNLGHPPRRLVMLHLDGSENELPERGDAVFAGDAEAGAITSSARHHELGPIALAIVGRRTPGDDTLTVEHDGVRIAATQDVIVPADAGSVADVPRLTRLSRRRPASSPSA